MLGPHQVAVMGSAHSLDLPKIIPTKQHVLQGRFAFTTAAARRRALRYTDGRPPDAGKSATSMGMRKKGHGFLSYRGSILVRHCREHVRSGLRGLAMPAQKPRSHGAISAIPESSAYGVFIKGVIAFCHE